MPPVTQGKTRSDETTDEMTPHDGTTKPTSTESSDPTVQPATTERDAQLIRSILELVRSGSLSIPSNTSKTQESKKLNDLDKMYKTSAFTIPVFADKTKLADNRNYKLRKKTLQLPLQTNMLLPFIHSQNGTDKVQVSDQY